MPYLVKLSIITRHESVYHAEHKIVDFGNKLNHDIHHDDLYQSCRSLISQQLNPMCQLEGQIECLTIYGSDKDVIPAVTISPDM